MAIDGPLADHPGAEVLLVAGLWSGTICRARYLPTARSSSQSTRTPPGTTIMAELMESSASWSPIRLTDPDGNRIELAHVR